MLRLPVLALAALFVLCGAAGAAEFLYSGSALPTQSGWELYGTSSYENGGGITSAIVAQAWRLADAGGAARCLLRNTTLGDLSFDIGVSCAARVRCESATSNSSYILGISNGNVGGMFLKLTVGQLYLVDLSGHYRGSAAVNATSYTTYHMTVKNSTPGDNSTALWRVYVDGVQAISWSGAGESAGYDGIMAGHAGISGTGVWWFAGIAARSDGAFTPIEWHPITEDPPPAPVINRPEAGTTVGLQGLLVTWSAEKHDRYEVSVCAMDSPQGPVVWSSGPVPGAAGVCTGGPITSGTRYVFVRVGNAGGWSPWSAGVAFTASASIPPPEAPTIILPGPDAVTADTTPLLQWTCAPADARQIQICGSDQPGQNVMWDSGLVISSADRCDVGPLVAGQYWAFLRVHGPGGWSQWNPEGRHFAVDVSAQQMKQGWVLIRDEPIEYYQELLSHAPEYSVNTVHLSHSIIMYTWEVLNNPTHCAKINSIISAAHAQGVDEVVAWVHDIQDNSHRPVPAQFKTADGRIDLDKQAFWDWLAADYNRFFDACPDLDGIVLTLTENFVYGGADVYDRTATRHTGRTPEDSCLKLIETLWSVCQQRSRSLYVRNWTLYGGADRWIRNAIIRTGEPGIWMMSKATGAGDWDVIQEPYDIIGTCYGHRELVEFDVVGEFWGLTWTPWCGIDYMRRLWTEFALPRGADGAVARIDREDNSAAPGIHPRSIEWPNRINLYALDALTQYPTVSEDAIYDYFCSHWFGHAAAPRLASALKRSFDLSNACYNLPKPSTTPDYSYSDSAGRSHCLASLFDIDCVNASLGASTRFQPASGLSDYEVIRIPFERAAAKLGLAVPRTLFGDFGCSVSPGGAADCTVTLVDAGVGFSPASLSVGYSSNAGASWTPFAGAVISATGGPRDPFIVDLTGVPFPATAAARNRVRFTVTYPGGQSDVREFTVKGAAQAFVSLAGTTTGDGIAHPQPQNGDGDTVAATAGGRPCRRASTASDTWFYLHVDDGFCFDGQPSTLYLQVDCYGSGGQIMPVYDSVLRTDETLTPVYLAGPSGWRTATWRLDDVNFSNRLTSGADIKLYVGSGTNVYISGVRLCEERPQDMLEQPQGLLVSAAPDGAVSLSWQAVPGASGYAVYRGASCVGIPAGAGFTDTGLPPNTQYSYTVAAVGGSGVISPASAPSVVTTLPNPAPFTLSSSPGEWTVGSQLTLTPTGSFGWGNAAYCRYALDRSPTRAWTGAEPAWPPAIDPAPGWTTWRPEMLPTEPESGWLLYDGSTTQRCMSEEIVDHAGSPAWRLVDSGRVVNTKVKLARWPNVPVDRSQGVTMSVRMKAADSPLGWVDSGPNFGLSLPDCLEAGVAVRPDYVRMSLPDGSSGVALDNGQSYHTYTLTLQNRTYTLYRDGQIALAKDNGDGNESMWSGPFFGHGISNGVGAWSFAWIAWTPGCQPPAPWSAPLNLTAPIAGSGYYLHIRPYNADGVPGEHLDLGPFGFWDGITPAAPGVVDDGDYTPATALHALYTAAAPLVDRYEYAVGTSPGTQDLIPYTSNGQLLELTRSGLALEEGEHYFVSVRGVGSLTGPAGCSDGIRVAPAHSVASARALPDGSPAALYGVTVIAVFGDCVYIQQAASGIRVITDKQLEVGDVVDIAGVMASADGERRLLADAVFATSAN